MSIIVKKAIFGYGNDLNPNIDIQNTLSFDKTQQLQNYIDRKQKEEKSFEFNPWKANFGLVNSMADIDPQYIPYQKSKYKLYFEIEKNGKLIKIIAVRGVGYAVSLEKDLSDKDVWEQNTKQGEGFSMSTKESKTSTTEPETTSEKDTNPTIKKIIEIATTPLDFKPETQEKIANFITNHPALSASLLGVGVKTASTVLGNVIGSGTIGNTSEIASGALKWGAIAAALGFVAPKIIEFLSGTKDAAGTEGGIVSSLTGGGGLGGFVHKGLTGKNLEDLIVYDGGKETGPQTALLQRCLIRLGGGNLAMEKANLQKPDYTPIVGVKSTGKNYADDGRFGKETLSAVYQLVKQIDELNKNESPPLKVKDNPKEIPARILTSPACTGKTGGITQAEQDALDKLLADKKTKRQVKESVLHKDYPFLSTKNQKLHTTLMEQLKKDIKRG